jgi:hypothetical protein
VFVFVVGGVGGLGGVGGVVVVSVVSEVVVFVVVSTTGSDYNILRTTGINSSQIFDTQDMDSQ